MRYLKILLFAMLSVAVVAGPVTAANLFVNHGGTNSPIKVALEPLGAARNVVLNRTLNDGTTSNNVALSFVPGQSIAAGSLLNITFSGVQLGPSAYSLCAQNSNNAITDRKVGSITLGAAAAGVNLAIDTAVVNAGYAAGNFFAVVNGATCTNAAGNVLNLTVPATASTTMATVTAYLQTGGTTYDTATAANVANIMRQYAYGTSGTAISTIDYLANGKNGSNFTTGTTAANKSAAAINVVTSAVNYGIAESNAISGINVSALITLQDTASWQGIQRVYVDAEGAGTCVIGANIASNNAIVVGTTQNLTIGAGNISNTAAANTNNFAVCIDASGNVALNQRVISVTPDLRFSGGSNAVDLAAGSQAALYTWNVNAFQAILPYASTTSAYKTICMIDNVDTAASATIYADIMSSTSGTTGTQKTVGTVPAKSTLRADFDVNITPWTTGASEVEGTPIPTGLTDPERYAVKFTVTSNPDNIHISCFQADPVGAKRPTPVLKQVSAGGAGWWQ